MRPTEDELWRDERAATLRSRDHQRLFPILREGALRNSALRNNARTVRLRCPCCLGPLYVAADSNGESVTCSYAGCHTALETYLVDGRVLLEIATLDMVPDGDAP